MHELYAGDAAGEGLSFRGQFGFIPFTHQFRLPRHVHLSTEKRSEGRKLLPERILVLHRVALTEFAGEIYLVGHGSLVEISPEVPHTWNACPPGVVLPDGVVSTGEFTMVYVYSEPTKFFPLSRATAYKVRTSLVEYKGDLENIRFPHLSPEQVVRRASFVWNREVRRDLKVAS